MGILFAPFLFYFAYNLEIITEHLDTETKTCLPAGRFQGYAPEGTEL